MLTLLNKSKNQEKSGSHRQWCTDKVLPRQFRSHQMTNLECCHRAVCIDRFPTSSQLVNKQKMSIPKSLDAVAR